MNYRQRYLDILEFLRPYQRMWENEIMLQYPDPLRDYPANWVEELAEITDPQILLDLERKTFEGHIRSETLRKFYRKAQSLEIMPVEPDYPKMPETSFTFLYVIPKKQYEVRRLAPMIHNLIHETRAERVIDIGGGIGILAQTLTNQYNLKVTSIDADPVLQKTGSTRHAKNYRHLENRVAYVNLRVSRHCESFRELITPEVLTLGLHTCGPLALDQLRASVDKDACAIVNLGCCFHQLEHPEHQNVSEFARKSGGFHLPRFALTLAARGHRKTNEKDFQLKHRVKLYRYSMHVLLHDHYQLPEMATLGNSNPKLYHGNFGSYALEQLRRLSLDPRHSSAELDEFFADPERLQLIRRMVAAGLIRNAFGRLLELLIHLDRLFYLEEKGYEAKLVEVFDEEVSPRNLALTGRRG